MVGKNFSFTYSTWQWSMHTSCITKQARKNVAGNFPWKIRRRIAR
jgi:hypothetical protein